MTNDVRTLLYVMSAVMLLSAFAVADDVQELSWDDLIPETESSPQAEPSPPVGPGGGPAVDDERYWQGEAFDDFFAAPAHPMGVVEKLDGERVKLPGFIVPLEIADGGKVSEFLLVPYFGACIHYPPPPPNQIVYVTVPKPAELESLWTPVWVTGEMRTEDRHSDMGSASYSLTAETIEEYEY